MKVINIQIRDFFRLFILPLLFLFSLFLFSNQAKSQTILLSATFDADAEGFAYSDDTFRGTNQPAYASGNYNPTGGFSGGGLRVSLGGINNASVNNMSGGWSRSFQLNQDGGVTVVLRYRLYFAKGYESDECGQALVSIDGTLVSPGADDLIEEFCGAIPNLPADQDSGWQQVTIVMNLNAGTHLITVGGYNNKKNAQFGEFTAILFDNIAITQGGLPPSQETSCTDGIDNDLDGPTDCADTDCTNAPNCNPETMCNDGTDNDLDGFADCNDTDCIGASACDSGGQLISFANFDVDTQGFIYSDDAFRGTNQPAYASGNYNPTGGFSGGGLSVSLGGIDSASVNNMSGGWSRSFQVNQGGAVSIVLRYRLYFAKGYEGDECGQALVSIDGTLVSPGADDFLAEYCGAIPNLPADQDSGWQQVTIVMNLSPGAHVITVGGYNNKKNAPNGEFTAILFDNIAITEGGLPPSQETSCTDGIDSDLDGLTDCTDTDCTNEPSCAPITIFSDNFNDGNADGWTVVDDAGKTSNWQVLTGAYDQLNSNVGRFISSFHKGSFSYYNDGFALNNYEVSASITPLAGGSIGLMFRYQDGDNYYRFSVSRDYGFKRLERKLNGVFSTLSFDGRGPVLNQVHTITIDVNGPNILVYFDGEPLFGVADSSIGSGTIALFTEGNARFDNVLIKSNSLIPKVVIFQSTSYFVETSPTLTASAVARNVPSGGGVKFVLDNGVSTFTDLAEPYFGRFTNVSQGNRTITASIVNSSGTPVSGSLAQDTNVRIGVGGNYFVAFGDSITNGTGDDFPNDDDSFDGRNVGRGYAPILNDLLSVSLNRPITVMNEGLGGTKSGSGAASGTGRFHSTRIRHTESQYWLILFGSNDSNGTLPVPSGINCTEADFQLGTPSCIGTYKANMRKLILNLKNASKVPLLAKVPFVLNAPSSRDQLIQQYNVVVNQLVAEHSIPVTPPDFYNYFKNNQDEFADDSHPNGNGYISVANLWFNALIQSGILNQ